MRKRLIGILSVPALIVLAIGAYYIPPIHEHLAWRLDDVRTRLIYFFHPPGQAVFQPEVSQQAAIEAMVSATMQAYSVAQVQSTTPTPIADASTTLTLTSEPLPVDVSIKGFKYEDQSGRYNYCGPANFSMALTFWGWSGNRDVIGQALMPGNINKAGDPASSPDKNVIPYELQDFITQNGPGISTALRHGGRL